MEVWRRLVVDIIRKTHSERLFMESQVTQPAMCKQISDVMDAIDNWDIKRYAWVHAGGRVFDAHEHCGIIIRMLPKALRDKAVTDMPDRCYSDPDALKDWLREKIRLMQVWQVGTGAGGLHVAAEEQSLTGDGDDLEKILSCLDQEDEDMILAVKRAWQKRTRPNMKRPTRPGGAAATGQTRKQKCANCGAAGHSAKECRKPKVDFKDRACFKCGKRGLQGWIKEM